MIPQGLYAVCDDTVLPAWPLVEKAEALLRGGLQMMQLRMKRTPVREGLEAAQEIAKRCHDAGCLLLINDRVDLAWLSGADGVHLGDEDLPVGAARKVLGAKAVIGATVRDAAAATAAKEQGASYVGVGPVFETSTKQVAHAVLGLEGLRTVVRGAPLPVIAISGITLANIGQVAAAGAHGAAVVSHLLAAEDVPARARALAAAFTRGM